MKARVHGPFENTCLNTCFHVNQKAPSKSSFLEGISRTFHFRKQKVSEFSEFQNQNNPRTSKLLATGLRISELPQSGFVQNK